MPKDDKKEFLKSLGVDTLSSENDIKRAYKKIALQCHPDKNPSDTSARKQFEEVSKAFEYLVHDGINDSLKDYDKVFFDFLRDILFGSDGASDFFTYFCGSKQHSCISTDTDPDFRYQDDDEEEDIDGEQELESLLEIVKNRRKRGKPVPDEFHEEKLQELKTRLSQHKEDMKKDGSKKQAVKKGKAVSVPVAKPKPKSKKQLLAEQRRRAKEMEQIAMELEEKRKEEEEKEKQRKQLEVEKQKRLEEERIRSQNEERKRREREQKEREKQQKLDMEKEERRRRQQEEEKKRREEEEKRKKVEKEKQEREKAAKKAALQAAKEKEEQAKAASKNQNIKRQQQQQRTDQQQYPREIPPRFQKMKRQQQQQQLQTPNLPPPAPTGSPAQLNKFQSKPQQQPVGKKKDPNRFASKEYADLVDEVDDAGWNKGSQCKGSGWEGTSEDWEENIAEKWGADRQWGSKEGSSNQLVVDRTDGDSWPTVGSKSAIGDKPNSSLENSNSKNSSETVPVGTIGSKPPSSNWNSNRNSGGLPLSENWDTTCDESIDRALDATESKGSVGPGGVNWVGMGTGGLGGIIGTPLGWEPSKENRDIDKTASKSGWCGEQNSTVDSWNKTPGKGPKTQVFGGSAPTWGGTPADSSSAWVETSGTETNKPNSSGWNSKVSSGLSQGNSSSMASVDSTDNKPTDNKPAPSGWGEAGPSWAVPASVTGTACWDTATTTSPKKPLDSKDSKLSHDKVSGWLETSVTSTSVTADWNGDSNADQEDYYEEAWDGWTTASSKRNKAPKPAPTNDSNAWMSRSLKQLLDMGFKQEDAEKALRANHMNIESAISDLLSLTASQIEEASRASSANTGEPDPAEACRMQQQNTSTSKPNRKQRRKTQQQLQQQQAKQESKQTDIYDANSQSGSSDSTVKDPKSESNKDEKGQAAEGQSNKPSNQGASDGKGNASKTTENSPHLSPGKSNAGQKRATTGLIQTPALGTPTPMRTPMTHPLLHQQFLHQVQLHQLRMAQGGLLQPPINPQQVALLQQMAQLQMVQHRIAQQQLTQKHNIQAQQQLYQQQQQIALMMAQLQQQVMQQHNHQMAGNRFPSPGFQQSTLPPQSSSAQPGTPPQNAKNSTKAPSTEPSQSKPEEPPKASTADKPVTTVASGERITQQSPAPQSRLTQWKQPLLPDPETSHGETWGMPKIEQMSLLSGPVVSSSLEQQHGAPNLSPQANRIADPVSSRWGVDASLKLSADPPEFKPGVPWRPRGEGEEKSGSSGSSMESSPQGMPASGKTQITDNPNKQPGFPGGFSSASQFPYSIASSPWQNTEPTDSLNKTQANPSSIRPPPGLNTSTSSGLPDTPSIEERPAWMKNLMDGGTQQSFAQGPNPGNFQLGLRLGFSASGNSWSTQDGMSVSGLTPNSQPWAAPGGPSSSSTPSSDPSAEAASSTANAVTSAEQLKPQDEGISSWSTNQPIPSAEEKQQQPPVAQGPRMGSGRGGANPMSTWLVLRNLSPRADPTAMRAVCQQYGPLLTFTLNLRHGNSLIRYSNKDQAASARNNLNGMMVKGMQLIADFATDSDIGGFFEQTPDWSNNPMPPNPSFGNPWSFGTVDPNRPLGSTQGLEKTPQGPPPQMPAMVPPGMQWGSSSQLPAQLWGNSHPGAATGFPSQVPSMWSFSGGAPRDVEPQSGTNENGLVSPSMTTFLPPGLLNGGESV
ncbi:trinucleotide repeat-containing gene 6A protein isoform X1 [Nematostella vectensis]|uniref:trinucleotide repeat-containing gene 6A protein isoform X1 n=1 Tax=Nematostella vectensis TaxID=45351 RepID=UPI0020777FEE|nr:trinucleotide repeat-containing gene 6A protein isoform X1 [Nematostella vectensis]